jgi:hypothetical protein
LTVEPSTASCTVRFVRSLTSFSRDAVGIVATTVARPADGCWPAGGRTFTWVASMATSVTGTPSSVAPAEVAVTWSSVPLRNWVRNGNPLMSTTGDDVVEMLWETTPTAYSSARDSA